MSHIATVKLNSKTALLPKSDQSKFYVLPTDNLRRLVIRNRTKLVQDCNYVLTWKDTAGFGLQLAHADWVPKGMTAFQ